MLELADRRKRHTDISRLFTYHGARRYINETHKDEGAYIRDTIKSIAEYGWVRESAWPFEEKRITKTPPKRVYDEAKKRKLKGYARIRTLAELKYVMATGGTFIFGTAVYDSFMSPEVARTGIIPIPRDGENMWGGHALHGVDYDDTGPSGGGCWVQNSWGTDWGQGGWCYIPYEYLMNRDICDDFWTISV
jgi:C1A family cysteine protease